MPRYQFVVAIIISLILSACGGSGGGSGSNNNGGTDGGSVSGGSSGSTSITVSPASLSFTVVENSAATDSKTVKVTFKGDGMLIGYPVGVPSASWLIVDPGTDSESPVDAKFTAGSPGLTKGTYQTTVRFVTGKEDGSQIKYADIPVTLIVKPDPSLKITNASYTQNFIYGSSNSTESVAVNLGGDTASWSATSDKSWLKVGTASGSGAATLNTSVDVIGLVPGDYSATLNVVDNTNVNNKVDFSYTLHISAPELTADASNVLLGGNDGTSDFVKALNLSLNTGANAYPYKVSLSTDDGKSWLNTSKSVGNISAVVESISLASDTRVMAAGTYAGKVKIQAFVGDLEISKEIPVIFNKEANRIYAGSTGVAFSKLQNQSVLTRKIKIFSSLNKTDIPWTAESDQSWLSVSSSGKTGDYITLSATPGSLSKGQYFANVTIKSSDTSVSNQDSIRVGFVISEDTLTDLSVDSLTSNDSVGAAATYTSMVTSPVEPLVFTNVGNSIKAYNVYSGLEVRSFTGVVASAGKMTMSGDGRSLFIYDKTNFEAVEIDAETGVVKNKFPVTGNSDSYNTVALAYMRPNGLPILFNTALQVYDLTENKLVVMSGAYFFGVSLSVAADPSLVVNNYGQLLKLNYSSLANTLPAFNKGLTGTSIFSAGTALGAEGEACINADGTRVYTASGYPYNFPGTGIASNVVEQVLPGTSYPNAIQCVWNGLVIGGASAYDSAEDIFIYNGKTGANLGNRSSAATTFMKQLLNQGMAVSADATRLITLTTDGGYKNHIRFMSLPEISQ